MRFVPVACLKQGMVNAKNFYDSSGKLLLSSGEPLKPSYISRLKELGYQGIYIEDHFSSDIEIKSIISDQVRNKAVQGVRHVFASSQKATVKEQMGDIDQTKEMVQNIIEQVLDNNTAMINMVDLKQFDEYTYTHSVNVCVLAVAVGVSFGFNMIRLSQLGLAAILHDIGKMFIDINILNKPGALTDFEYSEIKNHSRIGYDHLKKLYNVPIKVYTGVLGHHERYDGNGYPNGLKGDEINLISKIICVCDVYDALTSTRPYRKALPANEAIEYIMANGGQMFDPEVVKKFVNKVAPYPVGTTVELSNGYVGIIAENFENYCLRPKVKIILNGKGEWIEPYIINLRDDLEYISVTILGNKEM